MLSLHPFPAAPMPDPTPAVRSTLEELRQLRAGACRHFGDFRYALTHVATDVPLAERIEAAFRRFSADLAALEHRADLGADGSAAVATLQREIGDRRAVATYLVHELGAVLDSVEEITAQTANDYAVDVNADD
jgi:hypothetical protein